MSVDDRVVVVEHVQGGDFAAVAETDPEISYRIKISPVRCRS